MLSKENKWLQTRPRDKRQMSLELFLLKFPVLALISFGAFRVFRSDQHKGKIASVILIYFWCWPFEPNKQQASKQTNKPPHQEKKKGSRHI